MSDLPRRKCKLQYLPFLKPERDQEFPSNGVPPPVFERKGTFSGIAEEQRHEEVWVRELIEKEVEELDVFRKVHIVAKADHSEEYQENKESEIHQLWYHITRTNRHHLL